MTKNGTVIEHWTNGLNFHLLTTQTILIIPGMERNTVGSYLIARFTFVSDCVTVRVAVTVCIMTLLIFERERGKKLDLEKILLNICKINRCLSVFSSRDIHSFE